MLGTTPLSYTVDSVTTGRGGTPCNVHGWMPSKHLRIHRTKPDSSMSTSKRVKLLILDDTRNLAFCQNKHVFKFRSPQERLELSQNWRDRKSTWTRAFRDKLALHILYYGNVHSFRNNTTTFDNLTNSRRCPHFHCRENTTWQQDMSQVDRVVFRPIPQPHYSRFSLFNILRIHMNC